MTLIGLDFDNTLISYDKLFNQKAIEKKLVDESFTGGKTAIRNFLRENEQEEKFTLLQGEVYGLYILEAAPTEGMMEALKKISQLKLPMKIVSHKTLTPYSGPAYNLQEAALKWLDKHLFFSKEFLNLTLEDVYFEETKDLKINRIKLLECTHFVDDLPDILEKIKNPTKRILYNPNQYTPPKDKCINMTNWKQFSDIIISEI